MISNLDSCSWNSKNQTRFKARMVVRWNSLARSRHDVSLRSGGLFFVMSNWFWQTIWEWIHHYDVNDEYSHHCHLASPHAYIYRQRHTFVYLINFSSCYMPQRSDQTYLTLTCIVYSLTHGPVATVGGARSWLLPVNQCQYGSQTLTSISSFKHFELIPSESRLYIKSIRIQLRYGTHRYQHQRSSQRRCRWVWWHHRLPC